MAHRSVDAVENVTIQLSADGGDNPDTIIFPDRQIVLTKEQTTLPIGRASRVTAKGFIASRDTAWFDNQVMSRNHAEITADMDSQTVHIRDAGSLHGTYLNENRLAKDGSKELRDGDKLRFGISVMRGQDAFAPTCVKVGIIFGSSATRRAATPENAFRVPDGSVISDDEDDDDENSTSDGETPSHVDLPPLPQPKPATVYSSDLIDLTEPSASKVDYPTIIDITSPAASHSGLSDHMNNNPEDAVVVEELSNNATIPLGLSPSPDLGDDNVANEAMAIAKLLGLNAQRLSTYDDDGFISGESDYGNESIHLSTDEDDDEDDLDGYGAIVVDTSSDNDSESSGEKDYPEDEEMDSELERELDSELEFEAEYTSEDGIYEEEELEELHYDQEDQDVGPSNPTFPSAPIPGTNVFTATYADTVGLPDVACPHASGFYVTGTTPPEDYSQEAASPKDNEDMSIQPGLHFPKKSTSVSIEELLNNTRPQDESSMFTNQASIPTTVIAAPIPASNIRPPSPSDAALAKSLGPYDANVDTLGKKTGKFEFFAAREENKSKAARMAGQRAEPSSAPACGMTESLDEDRQPVHGPFAMQKKVPQSSIPMSLPTEETVLSPPTQRLAHSDWYELGANFLKTPIPHATEHSFNASYDDDEDEAAMTSAYTFQQHKMKQIVAIQARDESVQAPPRTHVGIPDILDSCQSSLSMMTTGKRKADSISECLSPAEEKFEAAAKSQVDGTARRPATPPSTIGEALATPPPSVESIRGAKLSEVSPPELPELSQPPATDSAEVAHVSRPTKRRRLHKLVERVGYAALGGVTVGAMVVGSLIYTAPAL
ncbi:hypothetical protein GQ53DRAFT_763636 [Thozetella sp. PMI_491]|nr:hypothetical protein GQ53DRAFT_763636 [Thozetella sp. PMI_491]